MNWIFEVSVEGAICEPKKINFFFGSDKLLMIEIKSKRAYNTLMLVTRWHNRNGSIFVGFEFFLVVLVVIGENIDDLKFNTFFGGRGEGNDQ